jgi:hypothetical protein
MSDSNTSLVVGASAGTAGTAGTAVDCAEIGVPLSADIDAASGTVGSSEPATSEPSVKLLAAAHCVSTSAFSRRCGSRVLILTLP